MSQPSAGTSIGIAILGRGRMGRAIQSCIADSSEVRVASMWVRDGVSTDRGASYIQSIDLGAVFSPADVAIDFTLPAATEQVIAAAIAAGIPLVCGVSGLTEENRQHMADAAGKIPVLYDRNLSLGVAVMRQLVELLGSTLGDQFSAEIHETHHVHKIDAPSGTALQLGEVLAASRGQSLDDVYHYDKDGNSSPDPGDIHFEVVRRGEVPGEHSVIMSSTNETLSLTHKVTDRRVFAAGAIKAARWLLTQRPGLYGMQDLVADTKRLQ